MESNRSRGLGDTIEHVTKITGIKKVVNKVSEVLDVPCGCEERKEVLNNMFPYRDTKTFVLGKKNN